jgi:hypothetical protein
VHHSASCFERSLLGQQRTLLDFGASCLGRK